MQRQFRRLCGAALWLWAGGCSAPATELSCAPGPCEPAPNEVVVPQTRFEPPVITSEGCAQPATVVWVPEDFTNEQGFALPCLTERLNAQGCVGDRLLNTFDAGGRVVRSQRWVIDPAVLPPLYVMPTDEVTTFVYDAQGRLQRSDYDQGSDGQVDRVLEYTHDTQGRVVGEVVTDLSGAVRIERVFDGEDRVVQEWTYQAAGVRHLSRSYSDQGDLLGEYVEVDGLRVYVHELTYDSRRRPLVEALVWTQDGRSETTEYEYDARGEKFRTWTRADPRDRSLVERYEFERWPDGALRLTLWEQVVNNSRVSHRRRTEYDRAGRELTALNDDDLDGEYESGWRYTYDPEGRRLTEYTFRGEAVLRDLRRTFDAEGREVELRDYVRQFAQLTTYGPNQVTVASYDLAERLLSRQVTTYDDLGQVLGIETDGDGDGLLDRRVESSWTAGGLPLRSRVDRDADGTWDYDHEQGYDRAGQRLYALEDHDGDGATEWAELVSYACLLARQ